MDGRSGMQCVSCGAQTTAGQWYCHACRSPVPRGDVQFAPSGTAEPAPTQPTPADVTGVTAGLDVAPGAPLTGQAPVGQVPAGEHAPGSPLPDPGRPAVGSGHRLTWLLAALLVAVAVLVVTYAA